MLCYSLGHRAAICAAYEEAMTLLKRGQALFERLDDTYGQGLIALDLGLIEHRGEQFHRAPSAFLPPEGRSTTLI